MGGSQNTDDCLLAKTKATRFLAPSLLMEETVHKRRSTNPWSQGICPAFLPWRVVCKGLMSLWIAF